MVIVSNPSQLKLFPDFFGSLKIVGVSQGNMRFFKEKTREYRISLGTSIQKIHFIVSEETLSSLKLEFEIIVIILLIAVPVCNFPLTWCGLT